MTQKQLKKNIEMTYDNIAFKYRDIKTSNNLELLNYYLYILTKFRANCNEIFHY